MIIPGPVPASIWGKMWAKAIAGLPTNTPHVPPMTFKDLLEKDMRAAVQDFLKLPPTDFVEPLFDEDHRMACQSLKDFYYALEELNANNPLKLTNFRDGIIGPGDPDVDHVLTMTQPNRWTLTELVTGATCELTNDIVPGVGKPHLDRVKWARVYAGAITNSGYLQKLKSDPKKAIDDFPVTFPGAPLPHNPPDPVLRIPMFNDLLSSLTLPIDLLDGVPPGTKLRQTLTEIAEGVCLGYEATLCVSLSC